jgi:hypothetical protein
MPIMLKDRKEYRKKYNAAGLLHVGGETLRLYCYDVSVKGAMVEVIPGTLLSTVEDFQAFMQEDRRAEIYIEDLMLSGEVLIAWVKGNRNRIMMGIEFNNVVHNANKLWHKRRNYRKKQLFSAELIIDKDHLNVDGINCSTEGVCLRITEHHPALKVDTMVKLKVKQFGLNALGKVVWMRHDNETAIVGMQILALK